MLERLALGFVEKVISKGLHRKVLIDLGCGFGRWGHIIRSSVDEGGHEVGMIGCDIFRPYLKATKEYNPYDDLICCDVRYLPFQERSVDIALAFEVIEHLRKKEGHDVLAHLLKICRDRVIVSTPSGRFSQGPTRQNEFERHVSSWTEKDFKKLGFAVSKYGLGVDLELLCRRLHFYRFLYGFARLVHRDSWGGVMLIAERHR